MDGNKAGRAARAAVLALTICLATGATPLAQAGAQPGPCPATLDEGETVRQNSRELIRCAVSRWSVPGGVQTALCIARRESGLLPWAESGDGINKGLYQQHIDYWRANFGQYTRPVWQLKSNILNGRTNAIVSIRMAHTIGWGPWGGRACA